MDDAHEIDPYRKVSLYHTQLPIGIRYDKHMKLSERFIFGGIYTMINQGKTFWASNRTIANKLGMSQRTVSRDICDLAREKLIVEHFKMVTKYNGTKQRVRLITGINYHKLHELGQTALNLGNKRYRQQSPHGLDRRVHTVLHKLSTPYRQKHGTNKNQHQESVNRIKEKNHHPQNDDDFKKSKIHTNKQSEIQSTNKASRLNKDHDSKTRPAEPEKSKGKISHPYNFMDFDDPFYNLDDRKFDTNKTLLRNILIKELHAHYGFRANLTHYTYKCIDSWLSYSLEDIRAVTKAVFNNGFRGKSAIRQVGVALSNAYQDYEKRTAKVYSRIIKMMLPCKSEYTSEHVPIDRDFIRNKNRVGRQVASIIAKHYGFLDIRQALDSSMEIHHISEFDEIIQIVFAKCDPESMYDLLKSPLA